MVLGMYFNRGAAVTDFVGKAMLPDAIVEF
jgi:hypothetical protein